MSLAFKRGDYVVYPAHGVGEIVETEEHLISNVPISVYVIRFPNDNMTVRLPVVKANKSGLRPLVDKTKLSSILKELEKPVKIEKTLWKKKSAEYEKKLNSGDLKSIATVLRALHQEDFDSLSYTKKELYHIALKRICDELAIVEKITPDDAIQTVKAYLKKH